MIGLARSAVEVAGALLDAQRRALVEGDFAALVRLAPELERAFLRLSGQSGDVAGLGALRDAASRNAVLLRAAERGLAQARQMIGPKQRATLSTYDARGGLQSAAPGAGRTLARR